MKQKKEKREKEKNENRIIRDIRTLLDTEKEERIKKQNEKLIKDGTKRDIRIIFEQEKEEDYYEPKKVNKFWNNNYIKYESNGDKNKNLSLGEYLNKIETYLENIMINLQNFDTWKIQLPIALKIISSKDTDQELIMHLNSDIVLQVL